MLSPALYSMMVLMAVTTTLMTTPLLALLRLPDRDAARPASPLEPVRE